MELYYSHFITLLSIFIFFPTPFAFARSGTNLTTDLHALLALKSRITSDPHGRVLNNWTVASPICNWIGVTCGRRHSRVTGLNFSEFHLSGSIPPELGNMSFLISVDIRQNSFGGPLSQDLGRLHRLEYINFMNNHFTGEVPYWFSSLPQLHFLSLKNNSFTELNSFLLSISNASRLEYLDVSSNRLFGTLPEDMCLRLPALKILVLSNNKIQGQIPSNISMCSQLQVLYLGRNRFGGTIPQEIGSLEMLRVLALRDNELTGVIPPTLGNQLRGLSPESIFNLTQLQMLMVDVNQLSGRIPYNIGNLSSLLCLNLGSNKLFGEVPSTICSLTSLLILDLSNNNLEGRLPDCLGNLSKALAVLDLHKNHFRGPIPTSFTKGCALQSLILSSNGLEGTLPQSLANCRELKVLSVGNNKINDTFPIWLETLSELLCLDLNCNRFHGTIPNSKRAISFPKLQVFVISHNNFTGDLPITYLKNFGNILNMYERNEQGDSIYFVIHLYAKSYSWSTSIELTITWKGVLMPSEKMKKTFTMIDISSNKFYGNNLDSFGNFTSIMHLNLSHNKLTGYIPKALRFLTLLEVLDLSSNHLIGEIPMQLTNLNFLSTFNISYNNLSGHIPQSGGQFLTFDNSSYIGNFELCGKPLTKTCVDEKEQPPIPSSKLADEKGVHESMLDGMTWQGVLMGYGFGVFIGVVLGIVYFQRYFSIVL